MTIPTRLKDFVVFLVFMVTLYLFFLGDEKLLQTLGVIFNPEWKSVFLLFLGILLEALPFLLLGAFASALVQLFVSEELIEKIIPKNPILGIFVALIVAVITPVCECAIIPVVRRLIQKGVPVHIGTVLLISAPILNFIVFASTYYAFQQTIGMVYARFIVCVIVAILVGIIMYIYFAKENVLKIQREDLMINIEKNINRGTSKWKGMFHHTCHEFFSIGKYFIFGAFLASIAQVFIQRSFLVQASENTLIGTLFMMGFAYLVSICSEADAFVGASFSNIFPPEAILGFLVFGPILDLKNTLVMLASFKVKFVLYYLFIVSILVFSLSLLVGRLI